MQRGFVLVTMLCSIVVLVGFLGLAIDTGYLELVKTRMQTAADAAALGGTQEMRMSGSAGVVAAARADAALNGFTHNKDGVTVTVNSPPAGGYSTGDSTGVEVIVERQVPTLFMSVLGSSSVTLHSRSVARLGNGATCLHVLDPSANGAFTASGGADVAIACGIAINSSSSSAFKVSGSNTVVTASTIRIKGGSSISGGATVTPGPVSGMKPEADPLAYVPAPNVGACDHTSINVTGGASVTLPPGVYCNGISVSGVSKVIFSPAGTFILKGGGLSISGNSTVEGSGVTLYNTEGGGYAYKAISVSGNSKVTLSAPTAGPLAGMLFFQDRSTNSNATSSFSGGANLSLTGALYFPTTAISYSGGTDAGGSYSIIVAKTATFTGGCKMNNDYSSLPGGSPVRGDAVISE